MLDIISFLTLMQLWRLLVCESEDHPKVQRKQMQTASSVLVGSGRSSSSWRWRWWSGSWDRGRGRGVVAVLTGSSVHWCLEAHRVLRVVRCSAVVRGPPGMIASLTSTLSCSRTNDTQSRPPCEAEKQLRNHFEHNLQPLYIV